MEKSPDVHRGSSLTALHHRNGCDCDCDLYIIDCDILKPPTASSVIKSPRQSLPNSVSAFFNDLPFLFAMFLRHHYQGMSDPSLPRLTNLPQSSNCGLLSETQIHQIPEVTHYIRQCFSSVNFSKMSESQIDMKALRAKFPALQQKQVFLDNAGGSQILGAAADS